MTIIESFFSIITLAITMLLEFPPPRVPFGDFLIVALRDPIPCTSSLPCIIGKHDFDYC